MQAFQVRVPAFFFALAAALACAAGEPPATISVDYPARQTIFPPDFTAPTFLWRDPAPQARKWVIEISFGDRSRPLRIVSAGEPMTVGEIDPAAVASSNEPPRLTPEQAAAHAWKPDERTWAAIKARSVRAPATVAISGFEDEELKRRVSRGEVDISVSKDPVGAPVFYRDVPLMPNDSDKGVIKPLPASAVGLIKWRLRWLDEPQSKVVMEGLPTCANCHSFSRDGKTLGLDVDGPQNDKALYALASVGTNTSLRNEDVIRWPTVRDRKVPSLRASFMSQVSPDGRHVVTTIDDPDAPKRGGAASLEDKYYNANFMDYKFLQVFYPTRGILAWYDRETKQLKPLPGADDPAYVHTDGVWSPDGKWIVFARAEAKPPYQPGAELARYANDPRETQIRYDLYRVPFNGGRGGRPERIEGASANGMSNNFPKVTPDGRWIVFVRCRNGQLMRPDSKLYIVPFEGGKERLMSCNTPLMNSWHTFSPNGRWMAFSSKSRSPYTQMYLSHIDENGNDSPAVLIENSTAANRAVNIPEFVNVPRGALEKIDAPATEFYRVFNGAVDLMQKRQFDTAIVEWRKALAMNPDDSKVHFNLAHSLREQGRLEEAIPEYRTAAAQDAGNAAIPANLGLALAQTGKLEDAVAAYRASLAIDPRNAEVQADLGVVLFQQGDPASALQYLSAAAQAAPGNAEVASKYGSILAKAGRGAEAVPVLERAVELRPDSAEYRFNLAYVLGTQSRMPEAIPHMEKAVELSGGADWLPLAMLGDAYFTVGRPADAVATATRAREAALRSNNAEAAKSLERAIERYRSR